ncbi:MAG: hypothetical protein WCP97_06330 [bacterium]
MLRLVTQFDNEKMRASVATPTCGPCCSCCCCCVVTTLSSSIITSRNLGKLVEKQGQEKHISEVELITNKNAAYYVGCIVFPTSVVLVLLTYITAGQLLLLILTPILRILPTPIVIYLLFVASYCALFLLIRSRLKYKISYKYIFFSALITVLLLFIEAYFWIQILI